MLRAEDAKDISKIGARRLSSKATNSLQCIHPGPSYEVSNCHGWILGISLPMLAASAGVPLRGAFSGVPSQSRVTLQ